MTYQISPDVTMALIKEQYDFLETVSALSMLWWVSEIAVLFVIIGMLWRRRKDLIETVPTFHFWFLALAIGGFYLLHISFTLAAVYYMSAIKSNVQAMVGTLGTPKYEFLTPFSAYIALMLHGIIPFSVVLSILGIEMWYLQQQRGALHASATARPEAGDAEQRS